MAIGNYYFNVIFNTSGSNTKNEHFFDVPPFYFKLTELVDGEAYCEIIDISWVCFPSNFFALRGYIRTEVTGDFTIETTTSWTSDIFVEPDSSSQGVGGVVKTSTIYIYGNAVTSCTGRMI